MRAFECTPGMEISGSLALSLLINLSADEFQPALAKRGLDNLDSAGWYPFQSILDVFKEVADQPGSMFDFVAVGMAAVDRYDLPPEIANLPLEQFFLNVIPRLINRSYRNGEATKFAVDKTADKHLRIRMITAYPDDVGYGFMYGFARRFMYDKGNFSLKYDENQPRRDRGGNETIMHLTWN